MDRGAPGRARRGACPGRAALAELDDELSDRAPREPTAQEPELEGERHDRVRDQEGQVDLGRDVADGLGQQADAAHGGGRQAPRKEHRSRRRGATGGVARCQRSARIDEAHRG